MGEPSFMSLIWVVNLCALTLPLSLLAAESIRTRKPEETALSLVILGLACLELGVRFIAGVSPESDWFIAYRIANGLLFVAACWLALFHDITSKPVSYPWIRVNGALAAGALVVFWAAWRNPLLADKAFFLWQVVAGSVIGYTASRRKNRNVGLMLLVILLWIFSHGVHDVFFLPFYALLALFLLKDRVKGLVEIDILRKQLLREKETIFKLINEIGSSVRDITTSDAVLDLIMRSSIEATHASSGAIFIYEESLATGERYLVSKAVMGAFTPLHNSGSYSAGQGQMFLDADSKFVDRKVVQERETKIGEALVAAVEKAGSAVLIEDAPADIRIKRLGGSALNFHSIVAVPVKIKEELLGALVCVNKRNSKIFSVDDSSVLQTLADQAALSVNNARMYASLSEQERIQRELEIAKEIQMRLLPKTLPTVNGLSVSALMKTAREVGGDYYDCIKLDDDHMTLVIGDVAGKGVPAGMIVLIVRTVLHILVHEIHSPRQIISGLSSRVYSQMESREFMTFLCLTWDNTRRILKYAGAGHEHILHYDHVTRTVNRIRTGGVAIGMHPEIDQFLKEQEIPVKPGDLVVLYTDGITEAKKPTGEMYGLDRLQKLIEKHGSRAPEDMKQLVLSDIDRFTGDVEQYDDMTLMFCRFN